MTIDRINFCRTPFIIPVYIAGCFGVSRSTSNNYNWNIATIKWKFFMNNFSNLSNILGLHLYHHSILPIFGWMVIKICPTSPCFGLFPLINTLIHVIMYSYYALSAFGPKVQKYLWWKKYLTQIQLMQFVVFGIYIFYFLTQQKGYPIHGIWLFIG